MSCHNRWKCWFFLVALLLTASARGGGTIDAGFGEIDITPELKKGKPVWLAGYGFNRRATGVHDPLYARCVLLSSGSEKFALISVDLVGLQYPAVQKIRDALPDYSYVLVSSTHNHEGPDVIGIWGRSPIHHGVDPDYINRVVNRVVEMVHRAQRRMVAVKAAYGTAEDETLLHDSREPYVVDGVMRTLRFSRADDGRLAGVLVQWNCHPEAMGSRNRLITADFPYATVAALKRRFSCPVVYFSGAVGGLLAPPRNRIQDQQGNILKNGDWEYTRIYGEEVARLAAKALDRAEPLELTPLAVYARPIAIPLDNRLYQVARRLRVLRRNGRVWTGDFEKLGEEVGPKQADQRVAIETEVGYLRLGQLHVACIPGEIYPELVYGKYQRPVDPGADFPEAPLEKSVVEILPGKKWLLIGLANDEIGYIIPRRQWDQKAPYAYGRKRSQYGEINSCGSEVAPIIMKALENRVREAQGK